MTTEYYFVVVECLKIPEHVTILQGGRVTESCQGGGLRVRHTRRTEHTCLVTDTFHFIPDTEKNTIAVNSFLSCSQTTFSCFLDDPDRMSFSREYYEIQVRRSPVIHSWFFEKCCSNPTADTRITVFKLLAYAHPSLCLSASNALTRRFRSGFNCNRLHCPGHAKKSAWSLVSSRTRRVSGECSFLVSEKTYGTSGVIRLR